MFTLEVLLRWMSWICKQGNDKAGALTAIAGRGSPVAWHACEMFYFALMTLMHPRHFLIGQSATFRSKNSVDAAFLTKWNITNLNQNWVRGEEDSCNCYVSDLHLLVCPFSPTFPRKGKMRCSLCSWWKSGMDSSVVCGHGNFSF